MNPAIRLLLLLCCLLPVAGADPVSSAGKPNIVFFLVDDMGWQETSVPFHTGTTALNQRYHTPNMARLAAESVKFTQAYACAVCSPTRVSAISGMNAARHRVTNWTLRKNTSPDTPHPRMTPPEWNLNGITTVEGIERTTRVTPLPALLREAGYHTIHVGKAHFGAKGTLGEDPRHCGFDQKMTWHFPHHYGQTPFSSIRKGPWKLIHHHADRRLELFNLDADLGERNDLAAREPGKLSELAHALTKRLREMNAQMPLDPATLRPLPAAEELLEQATPAAAAAAKTTVPRSNPEQSPQSRDAVPASPLRVACMGDSITHGGGGKDSYPAKLGALLGEGHTVRNFGAGGTTLLAAGDKPYRKSKAYRDAMESDPRLTVIMLGTNDTCGPPRGNWGKSAAFGGDAAVMLRALAKPGRRTIVALPPPMMHDRPGLKPERAADLRERAPRLAAIRDWWRQEAAKLDIEIVDLTNIFDSDPRWTTDGVHPTPAGYDRIANRIAEAIRGAQGVPGVMRVK